MFKLFYTSIFLLTVYSANIRCVSKFSTKLNDIDSVIRIANPDHICNCNKKNKSIELPESKNGNINTFFWKGVLIKNPEGVDFVKRAIETKAELIKLMPGLSGYKRIYFDFYELQFGKQDTVTAYKLIGTAYLLKGKCDGFIRGINAKSLAKRSHSKKFEATLCKK